MVSLCHNAGVGKDVTVMAVGEENGDAGAVRGVADDVSGVEAGCGKVREG